MKTYNFHPTLLMRIPALPYSNYKIHSLQQHLNNITVRSAIRLASATLYAALEKVAFNTQLLSQAQQKSIWNYINRMHYRNTPFALFAGTGVAYWSASNDAEIIVNTTATLTIMPGFEQEEKCYDAIRSLPEMTKGTLYYCNPSMLVLDKEIRYLTECPETLKNIKTHELKSIAPNAALKKLFVFCKTPKYRDEIVVAIMKYFEAEREYAFDILHSLIKEGLLWDNLKPNISGIVYSQRLLNLLNSKSESAYTKSLSTSVSDVQIIPTNNDAIYSKAAPTSFGSDSYAHLTIKTQKDKNLLSSQYQSQILDGVFAIEKLELPSNTNRQLNQFKESFLEKFDQRCLPLMQILDPEWGIGYADLESSKDGKDDLLESLSKDSTNTSTKKIDWTEVHAYLLSKWNTRDNKTIYIQLEETELESLAAHKTNEYPSSSMPVIFKILKQQLFLEHIGGCTANAILGRFSLFHSEIEAMCKHIAETEKHQNPDVLFAEIIAIQDIHAANIEKRKQFHDFEIPIFSTASVPFENQIQLSDLYVLVRENRIVLFSKIHNKEVIPRLSTAFNYQRSSLAVYRFLCDLQFQSITSLSSFQLQHYFPNASFYPRVTYKQTILQLASWHIKKNTTERIFAIKDKNEQIKLCKMFMREANVPRHFAIVRHDNQVVFDAEDEGDILMFLDNVKNQAEIIIQEFPFVEAFSLIGNTAGDNYQNQFVTAVTFQGLTYDGSLSIIEKAQASIDEISNKYIPGSEWMYFKIYCHPNRANDILLTKIKPLLRLQKVKTTIEKWFFIRYNDPKFHIRLRLLVAAKYQAAFLDSLKAALNEEIKTGAISTLQIDTYIQEQERYGYNKMDTVEDCFYYGSKWVLDLLLLQQKGIKTNIEIAIINIHVMLNAAPISLTERISLLKHLYDSLQKEHFINKNDEIELGIKYRNYQQQMKIWLNQKIANNQNRNCFEQHLKICLSPLQNLDETFQLLSNLIHMQLNRIFSDQSRKREMVVYFLMFKWYQTELYKIRFQNPIPINDLLVYDNLNGDNR
jgi:thiopeptide-type bacteriocin biosynthesis protein